MVLSRISSVPPTILRNSITHSYFLHEAKRTPRFVPALAAGLFIALKNGTALAQVDCNQRTPANAYECEQADFEATPSHSESTYHAYIPTLGTLAVGGIILIPSLIVGIAKLRRHLKNKGTQNV